MSSFASGLSNLASQDTGFDTSQLQAAIQGQPGIYYQSLINTLVQQQPAPGVNYQTLISQLQQVHAIVNAQQATAQIPSFEAIYAVNMQQMQSILNLVAVQNAG